MKDFELDTNLDTIFPILHLRFVSNLYLELKGNSETIENTDALLLLTEWNEFRRPDFERIKTLMRNLVIFDGRNQYDKILV